MQLMLLNKIIICINFWIIFGIFSASSSPHSSHSDKHKHTHARTHLRIHNFNLLQHLINIWSKPLRIRLIQINWSQNKVQKQNKYPKKKCGRKQYEWNNLNFTPFIHRGNTFTSKGITKKFTKFVRKEPFLSAELAAELNRKKIQNVFRSISVRMKSYHIRKRSTHFANSREYPFQMFK